MKKLYVRVFEDGAIQGPEYRDEITDWSEIAKLSNGLPVFRLFEDAEPAFDLKDEILVEKGTKLDGNYNVVVEYEVIEKTEEEKRAWIEEARKKNYPDWHVLADAIYWKEMGDETKMQEYITLVTAVKEAYPK